MFRLSEDGLSYLIQGCNCQTPLTDLNKAKLLFSYGGDLQLTNCATFLVADAAIDEVLRKLKVILLTANRVLNDAESKQITDKDVRQWLQELRDEIYNEEDMVRNSQPSRVNVKKVEERIEKVLSTLQFRLLDQKDGLRLVEGVETRPFQRISEATLVKESDIYGRVGDKEAIMKLLLSNDEHCDNKVCVIPIVDMGGICKTTLAQLVYRNIDYKVMERPFNVKAWIRVSDEHDEFTLTKIIYEAITQSVSCGIKETFQLQNRLEQFLKGKKFLVVLDDVWKVNNQIWCALMVPFESAAHGCKIIMTARNKNIVSKIDNVQKHDLQIFSE
ncbi:putative disease resistance RPP13-like protein 1 [Ziziphus jujuba]|uniref:Disease resistance RPP13-like protein 1 n=1 Tax=Ziziphus jujuba TaxID=326968 RepID=A0ABM3ZXG7_ZIZJJ|nr:putative disease resistance RPP13-like protein 1 [Ziziphus jujuba]